MLYVIWYILANMYHLCIHGSGEYLTPVVTSSKPKTLKSVEETVLADLKSENTKLKAQMLSNENAMLRSQLAAQTSTTGSHSYVNNME